MQTFLPYPDFRESFRRLDYRRLGKQRVEAKQILQALRKETKAWRHHPATKMWHGYEQGLVQYGLLCCEEWRRRGFSDSLYGYFSARVEETNDTQEELMPRWMGNERFHAAHRSSLLRKDPAYYGRYGWNEPHDLPYIWPLGDYT